MKFTDRELNEYTDASGAWRR